MKPKRRRMLVIGFGLAALAGALALVLSALEENIVFFFSPTEVAEAGVTPGQRYRIGGLVKEGSVRRLEDGVTVEFAVTDLEHDISVVFGGMLPDLFAEGQGVVAEGAFRADGVFLAGEVLAKHDETYMPPEVADALKRAGYWQDGQEQ